MARPRVILLHYEAVPPHIKKLRKLVRFTLIVYDESQRLKNRQSIASRTAMKFHDSAFFKLALSGTPMDEQPQELWAQFRFLNNEVFGTRWADFEEHFLVPLDEDEIYRKTGVRLSEVRKGSFRWKKALRYIQIAKRKRPFDDAKMPEFLDRIKRYTVHVRADDVLDLPPLELIPSPVTLRGRQRAIYEALEYDAVAETINTTAALKVTKIGKLQQVCGGYVIDDEGEVHEVGRAKIRRVISIVRDHTNQIVSRHPIVIFARYREEVSALIRELILHTPRVASITGTTKKQDRPKIVQAFQNGKFDVLVCQIRTGGVGIDLFRADTGIMFSPTHSWIDFGQAIKRLHRRGQTKPVRFYLVYAEGTIDAEIYAALQAKDKVTSRVLNHLKRKEQTWQRRQRPQQPSTMWPVLRRTSTSRRRPSA
jgi:SNF2 family DNA or RNA helicase